MEATTLRIGGVPEHFNLPWHRALAQGSFKKANIDIIWKDYPGGTGAMMQDIREGSLDVAVALTEGVVAEIIRHRSCSILQLYVQSPLIWGIHVAAGSAFRQVQELEGKRFAISRMGSGSHLMAFVNARQQGWDPQVPLIKVGDLQGADQALSQGEADAFMWEKFMTQPLVDKGVFRRVGECPTPWPCFVIAASENVLAQKQEALTTLLNVINQACQDFMNDVQAPQQVADRFDLRPEDAQAWFAQTRWATNTDISEDMLQKVMDTLYAIGSISEKVKPKELLHQGV